MRPMAHCALLEENRKIKKKRLSMWRVSLIGSTMIHLFKNGAEGRCLDEPVVVVAVVMVMDH